jgi:membrane protein implicated in regulation of membrane protease activity
MGTDDAAVGRVGVITHATRGPAGAGEVKVSVRGGSEIFLAWSDRPLPKGTTVLVVASRGARALDVVPWTAQ